MAILMDGDSGLILDWLSFSVPYDDGLALVERLFGKPQLRPRGIRGYTHSATICGSGVVGWSPERPEQKVHVQMPSTALSQAVEAMPGLGHVRPLLQFLVEAGAVMRRVDFALDDLRGLLSMARIGQHVAQDWFVSRSRQVDRYQRLRGGDGETFFFGSRSSESYVRIYDKRAERMDKGEDDPGHWIRVELELKGDKAQAVVESYLGQSEAYLVGLLRGLLEFKEPSSDETKTRWLTAPWWAELLDGAEKVRLSMPREQPTLERCKSWMHDQVAPSLAMVLEAEGSDRFFEQLVASGRTRLSDQQRAIIAAAQGRRA